MAKDLEQRFASAMKKGEKQDKKQSTSDGYMVKPKFGSSHYDKFKLSPKEAKETIMGKKDAGKKIVK